MNFYNPLLPFSNPQTLHNNMPKITTSSQLSPNFQSNLAPRLVSLNKKRNLNPQNIINLDSTDLVTWEPSKKVKPNENFGGLNIFNLMDYQKNNDNSLLLDNLGFGMNKKRIEIIDLEIDNTFVLGNPVNNLANKVSPCFNSQFVNPFNSNSFPNVSNHWNLSTSFAQQDSLLKNLNLLRSPSAQDLLLLELRKQTGSVNLLQQLNHRDQVLSQLMNFNPEIHSDQINNQLNLFKASRQEFGFNITSTPKKEIIIIDEEDSPHQINSQSKEVNLNQVDHESKISTKIAKESNSPLVKLEPVAKCQENKNGFKNLDSVKLEQKVLAKKLNNLLDKEIKKDIFEPIMSSPETQATCTPQNSEISNQKNIYADIPAFDLINSLEDRKLRKPKLVWDPNTKNAETYRKGFDSIQKTVGIEITNEIKVIEALNEYGMNLEIACEKIKRNKAFYKNHFRVQRSLRSINHLH